MENSIIVKMSKSSRKKYQNQGEPLSEASSLREAAERIYRGWIFDVKPAGESLAELIEEDYPMTQNAQDFFRAWFLVRPEDKTDSYIDLRDQVNAIIEDSDKSGELEELPYYIEMLGREYREYGPAVRPKSARKPKSNRKKAQSPRKPKSGGKKAQSPRKPRSGGKSKKTGYSDEQLSQGLDQLIADVESRPRLPATLKPCEEGKVRNPATGRCVKPDSASLKPGAKPRSARAKSPAKPCSADKIRNPATGRCVSRDSKIGKTLV